jgi:NodT family efflux transporter outer membrane factor (OMF) lipoprotein
MLDEIRKRAGVCGRCFGEPAGRGLLERALPRLRGGRAGRSRTPCGLRDPRWYLVPALLLELAGCAVGPDFVAPQAPVADTWLESKSRSVETRRELYHAWWKAFRDPVLDRLVETAYSQNLTLLAAGTRVLQARATLGIAIGELYPQQQQGTGAVTYNLRSRSDPTTVPITASSNYWRDVLGVNAVWEIDIWGKFRRGVESADSAYLASIARYDDVLVTLLGDVARTYVGIRTLEKQIAIARANVVRQKQVLRIARDKYEGGTATKLDVYQAENVLATTQASIPQLTSQLQQGQNALRVLLGMAPEPLGFLLARSTANIPSAPGKVLVGIPADLLRRRPDIRAAELKAAAQSAQIGVAFADLLPAVSISGTFGGAASTLLGNNLANVFQPTGRFFTVGPTFQWNLLNYGQITNNVRLQDATLQQFLVDYQNAVLNAQREVEDGLAATLQSRAQAGYLRKAATAAEGALGIALLEYQQGTRDFTTVLTAEQNLYAAQNSLAQATGNAAAGLVSVYRALGGGWQIREGRGFVDPATADEMRARTDWNGLLPPGGVPTEPEPGLPGPEDRGPTVRPPEW